MHAHRSVLAFLCGLSGCVLLLSCDSKGGGGMTEPTPSFTISVAPGSVTAAPGQSATVTVTLTRSGGFTDPVSLSLEGAPGGVSGTFQPTPMSGNGTSSTLTLQVGGAAAPGTYSTTVRARASGLEDRNATISLTIAQPAAIAVSVAPTSLALNQGGNGTTAVTVARTNFTGAVDLVLEGGPAGVTGSFAPANLTGAATASVLTVAVGSSAQLGTYDLTVRARGTGVTDASTAVSLTIAPQPAYELSLVPASLQLQQGVAGSARIGIARTNFTGAIALAVSGAPQGVTASITPASATADEATLNVSVSGSAAPGSYTLTITGQAAGLTDRTIQLPLVVAAATPSSYSLSVSPLSLQLQQGATSAAQLTIARNNFAGAVALAVSGAPAEVTATVTPASTIGSGATINVGVGASAAPGSYALTVTGQAAGQPDRSATLALTITAAQAGTVAVAASDANASEAGPDPGVFTITRTGSTAAALAVSFTLGGTATNGTDYTSVGGNVTIAAGQASATVTITPLADALTEGNETVVLTLAAGSYTVGQPNAATVTIADDAGAPASVTVAASDANASEAGPDPGVFTITRTGSTAAALAVGFTLGGTATNGTDYTSVGGNATIPAGQASATVTITPLADALTEGNETVVLTLAAGSYTVGQPNAATVTITDDAGAPASVTVAASDANASEAGPDPGVFTITRTGSTAAALAVSFTLGGTATNGTDYTSVGGNATIAAGQASATVPITPLADALTEGNETVVLTLAAGSYTVGQPNTATVTIADDGGTPPRVLMNGENHGGSITFAGELHNWTFDANQGDYIALSIGEDGTNTDFTPWIRLVAPDGTVVAESNNALVAQINETAATTGTYTVIVATADLGRDATGDYLLTLAQVPGSFTVPSGDQGAALTNGENHSGTIHRGDLDLWTFDANQGDYIALSIGEDGTNTDFTPWIRLLSPAGTVVATSNNALVAQINETVATTGTYTVIVATADLGRDATGDYLLTLAQVPGSFTVPSGDQGAALTNGENHSGTIHRGDLDMWTFDANQGDYIALSIGEDGTNTGFTPWIRLLSPAGTVVATSNNALVAQINETAATTGTYTVIVATADLGRDATGDYLLTLAQVPGSFTVPSGDDGGALGSGTNHPGTISRGDLDIWTFSATAGQAIILSIGEQQPVSDFTPWIRLISPTGAVVGNASGAQAAQISVNAAATGTFTVVVGTADLGRDAEGSYILTRTGGNSANGTRAGAAGSRQQ
jgi:trimeric autotransporter adhesin